jgi:hypothetical protein
VYSLLITNFYHLCLYKGTKSKLDIIIHAYIMEMCLFPGFLPTCFVKITYLEILDF